MVSRSNVLVTGATGFIGRRLAEELVRRGARVTCLTRPRSRAAELEGLAVRVATADYRDLASLEAAASGQDYVFHAAGVINGRNREAFYRGNVLSTRNLLLACRRAAPGLKRFVYVSSISAVGPSQPGRLLDERAEERPVSLYGRSKLEAERIVSGTPGGPPWVIVRPPNVLGPRQVELLQVIKLLRLGLMPLIGTGGAQTSVCDVDDLVEALILAGEAPAAESKTYLVTDGGAYAWRDITLAVAEEVGLRRAYLKIPYAAQYSVAALAEAVSILTGKPAPLNRRLIASGHRHAWLYDSRRIREELGFTPRYAMRDSVRRTVAWYRERGLI